MLMEIDLTWGWLETQESNRLYNVTAAGTAREALSDILVGGRYIIPKVPLH